ncbi:MAG TPA: hypothetical protein PLN52_00055, partial [Opitutaceae bacterium]|nr:hypothetical protein [Opitutaceae bacterium]
LVAGGDGLAQRSRPPLAIRRPSTTIRQDRSRSQALRSQHRRPCRAPAGADSFLHSRPVAFAPLTHLRTVPSCSTPRVTLRRRWAADAVVRSAQGAPGVVNPFAALRGRCCASTISALPRSVALVAPLFVARPHARAPALLSPSAAARHPGPTLYFGHFRTAVLNRASVGSVACPLWAA